MGAPINEKDSVGQTALHYAVCHKFALQVISPNFYISLFSFHKRDYTPTEKLSDDPKTGDLYIIKLASIGT